MRVDTPAFAQQNEAPAKEPRLVVRITFDVSSLYICSDPDMQNVPGVALLGHLQDVQAVSQEINPDEGRSTIGSMTFGVLDTDQDFSSQLRTQLSTNLQDLRERTVELRLGYTNDYNDTIVLFTQQVTGASFENGSYQITCNDIQRAEREEIFEPKTTTLNVSATASATSIGAVDTSEFSTVFHGPSYSDAPNLTVGYIKIGDEVIRYTGTTPTSFTGCTRGVFNTVPQAHAIESGAGDDRQPTIEEFIYLELPGPKLAYSVLTGVLEGDAATLPAHWHAGIATGDVTLAQFTGIGTDLWDTTNDAASFVLRFSGLSGTDAKQFLEEQVYQPLGLYSPVLADGSLGLRRMTSVLNDAPWIKTLDEDKFVQVAALAHDFDSLINVLDIDWNYDPIGDRFTRKRRIVDQTSIDLHGEADVKSLAWEGIHGSRHTDAVLQQRADTLRDRYAGPPLRMSGQLLHSENALEVGDVVRVNLEHVRDYTGAAGPIDRSFEIQQISVNQVTGDVDVSLFGSSQKASVIAADTGSALPDAFYTAAGTNLTTVLTITSGVTQTGTFTLTGNADMTAAGAVYYFDGDLTIADGTVFNIEDNVQLRVRGFLTINGEINGVGRGLDGTLDDGILAGSPQGLAGLPGFFGSTKGWNAFRRVVGPIAGLQNTPPITTVGQSLSVPFYNLEVDGNNLVGLPTDLRGSSGGTGARITLQDIQTPANDAILANGGTGGDGGSGLVIVCRGASFGASGQINLDGGAATVGQTWQFNGRQHRAGSGAGGAPGGCLFLVDGSSPALPTIGNSFSAVYGNIPSAGSEPNVTFVGRVSWPDGTAEPLAGLNESIFGDISETAIRIQRIAPEQTAVPDVAVVAPENLQVAIGPNGGSHLLTNTEPPAGIETEYFASTTDDRTNAISIGTSTNGRFAYIPDSASNIYYWARNREIATRLISAFTPTTTTSTVIGSPLNASITIPPFDPGFVGGGSNFVYTLNRTQGGSVNDGEVRIQGTSFRHPDGTLIVPSPIDFTVFTPFENTNVGRAFIMYSATEAQTRFGGTAANWGSSTDRRFVCVIWDATNGWRAIRDDSTTYTFTPLATDCLIAVIEKTATTGGLNSVTSLTSGLSGANSLGLVVNGDFETGDLTGWNELSTHRISSENPRSGSYHLEVDGGAGAPTAFSDYYPVAVGDIVKAECWAARDESDLPTNQFILAVRWYDSAQAFLSAEQIGSSISETVAGYQQATGERTAPASAAFVRIQVGGALGSGSWHVDDVFATFRGETGATGATGATGPQGIQGDQGVAGEIREFVFQRANLRPATPTGNGIPSGWSDDPPAGLGTLWMSAAQQENDGTLVGSWSTPVRLDTTAAGNALNRGRQFASLDDWFSNNAQTASLSADSAFSIISAGDEPIFPTSLETTENGQGDFYSERIAVEPGKKYRVSCWGEHVSGDRTVYLLVDFYDSAGNSIQGGTSDATGWLSKGTFHYWGRAATQFPADWTLYTQEFGGDATATIPTGAVTMAIGALTNYPGTNESTQRFHDYKVEEVSAAAINSFYTSSNGITWSRAPNAGAWTPTATTSLVEVTFEREGVALARVARLVTRSASGTFSSTPDTHSGGDLNTGRVAATSVGSGTAAYTLTFTYTNNGETAEISVPFTSTQGGDDGATGATGPTGPAGGDGNSVHQAIIFRRITSTPPTPTGGQYNFTTNTLTPPTGWSVSPPTVDGNPLFISVGTFSIQGTTGIDTTTSWSSPTQANQDAVVANPVTDSDASGNVVFGALSFPRVENTYLNLLASYTPSGQANNVQVNWRGRFNTSAAFGGSGSLTGETVANLFIQVDGVTQLDIEVPIDWVRNSQDEWANVSGSKTFNVPDGDQITARLRVYRNASGTGTSFAQTIYWADTEVELIPFNRA